MTTDGREQVFSHSEVTALYTYELSSGKPVAGGSLGGEKDEYVGVSPFGSWTLELPEPFNPGLDLSHVREVTIRFSGRVLPMVPEGVARHEVLLAASGTSLPATA
jgi:hypothetical protein